MSQLSAWSLMDLDHTRVDAPDLNDVVFTFDDGESLSCNRFLLAARSPVFKAMLYGHMLEANSEKPDIHISDSSPEAFRHFVHFLFTDLMDEAAEVTMLSQVLLLSRKYCVIVLQHLCENKISQILSPQNAGTLCLEAYTNGDFALVSMCLQVIASCFMKTPASEIAKLPLECMKLLVQADETIATELGIFRACMAWSQSRRQEESRSLAHLIRFQNITPTQFAEQVLPSGLLSPEHALEIMVAGVCDTKTRKPRQQINLNSVFVIGGLDSAFELDVNTGSHKQLPTMNAKRSDMSGCVCSGVLYCIGGSFCGCCTSSSEALDLLQKDRWVITAPMLQERGYHAVCSVQGKVYAIGGRDFDGPLATVEVFDPDTNQWSAISPMITARSSCSATVLDGKIFVTGGHDGEQPLSSVECYDPGSDSWSSIAPMLADRYRHASCACGGKLFLFGGLVRGQSSASTECYDPATGGWAELAPMPMARTRLACAACADSIIVGGGYIESDYSDSCDTYHLLTNSWERARISLPFAMADLAMCSGAGAGQ